MKKSKKKIDSRQLLLKNRTLGGAEQVSSSGVAWVCVCRQGLRSAARRPRKRAEVAQWSSTK